MKRIYAKPQQRNILFAKVLMMVGTINCASTTHKTDAKADVFTPEKILPAGEDYTMADNPYTQEAGRARKGIIAATLNNVVLLNELLLARTSDEKKIDAIMRMMKDLIPSVRAVGIFDLFKIDEWLNTKDQSGRQMLAILYLQTYPEKITKDLRELLQRIHGLNVHPRLNQEIDRAFKK